MLKKEIIDYYIKQVERFLTEEELHNILEMIKLIDKKGIKLYTSFALDELGQAEDEETIYDDET